MSKGAVLISGAAGGIGRATVDRFLAAGYEVAGIDIDPAVQSVRSGAYRGAVADVRDATQLAAACDHLLEGRSLRHVVGLVGAIDEGESYLMMEKSLDDGVRGFESSLATNLTSQYALIHCCFERLIASEGDRSITLCSSVNALHSNGAPAYSAAKAGLIGMMRALSTPFGRRGVRINVVAPGLIRTPLTEMYAEEGEDPGVFDRRAERVPLGRVGNPDDVAAVIEGLADRMTYVVGETVTIDGGHLLTLPPDGPPDFVSRMGARIRRLLHNRPSR